MRLLEEQIQRHVESMTYEHVSSYGLGGTRKGYQLTAQHGKLLEQSGLGPIMKTIRTRPADVRPLLHPSILIPSTGMPANESPDTSRSSASHLFKSPNIRPCPILPIPHFPRRPHYSPTGITLIFQIG